jgi:putative membrane protein
MWFGWGWGMIFFIPLCFIFGAIAIYYFLISSSRNCHSHYSPRYQSSSQASEILAERYARGEISREEFQQIRKELDR